MDEAVRKILDGKHVAVLATVMKDGSPKTAAVWYGFDGDDLIVSTITDRPKARNVARDGRVSLLIDLREMPYSGVEVRGRATLEDDAESEKTLRIARRYTGEVNEQWAARLRSEQRTIIRIKPSRFRYWDNSRR
jgi:PPOX class probable F420-dependent enzyme